MCIRDSDYPNGAMLDYMRMIGAKPAQIFLMLELPNSLPHVFSGLKVAATYSMMGAVISEWLGAQQGLGAVSYTHLDVYKRQRWGRVSRWRVRW